MDKAETAFYTIFVLISQLGGFLAFVLIIFAAFKFWKETDEEEGE